MKNINITTQTPLFLRFYARCFLYPYEEMGYELQHLFRQMERGVFSEDEYGHLDQVLNIINHYQGEDIKILREDYVILFSHFEGNKPLCPLIAVDFMQSFGRRYDSAPFVDELLDSGIPVNPEEPMDSIVNYLEFFSLLCEYPDQPVGIMELDDLVENHIIAWIPLFTDILYKSSNVAFYKEVATGLKNYLLLLSSE